MAKNKTAKKQQLLSPENYIRQKARNLPIHECYVQSNWQVSKMTTAVIARKHSNGNITMCIYLVDLACLGVKDSFFRFNIDTEEYNNLLEKISTNEQLIPVSYELAHNIVYSALAYADELGFKPCKEFSQTTRFMLEEDTDDVELIEIECGINGKPMYIGTGFESDFEVRKITQQLEKAVGIGNFEYMIQNGGFDYDEDDYDEDDYDDYEEFEAETDEDK